MSNFIKANLDVRQGLTKLDSLEKPHEDFLFTCIKDWQDGDKRALMLSAQAYYENDNDINERKRYYIDRKGIKQEVTNLSNTKLSHPFLRKLTNQKINYLLSRELSIQSEDEQLVNELQSHFDSGFLKMLKNLGKDAIVNGLGWLQVYYTEKGELKFKRIPPEEIIPFWIDIEHNELEGIIRIYSILKYFEDGVKKEIKKIEYYTTQGVWYYEITENGLKPDPEKEGRFHRGHFNLKNEDQELEVNWQRIPFIAFKYNPDEISLLKDIKSLIDDYDIISSEVSNTLQDVPNSIKVVKNYDGTDKGEFTQNLAIYRTAFVNGDGDMKTIETNLDVTAIDSHLNRLRKDIYEAGRGVDTQEISLGNASGVALKFRYADLDSDTDELASEFKAALNQLVWFIITDLANGKGIKFENKEIDFIFNTDGIINESEVIVDARNSLGIISEETIIANHPWVTDALKEKQQLDKEREKQMKDAMMQEGFGNESDN